MKKYIFPAVAVLALLASCAKEEAVIVEEPTLEKVEIRATINNEATKTDYDLSGGSIGYFHWTGQETIGRLYRASTFGHDSFVSTTEANSNETSLVFRGGYSVHQTDYFMYPIWNNTSKTGIGWSSNPFNLYLHESMVYNASEPLKDVVPMIGKVNGSGEIDFVPVSGVIAVTVKNLPSTANKIKLSTTGKALSGNYRLTSSPADYASHIDDVMINGLTAALASDAGNTTGTKSFTFSGLDKGVHVFYFPVSVGEFKDMTITIYADSSILQTVSTTKTITVGRGQIVKFPEMDLAKATKVSISGNSNEAYIYVDAFGPDATSVKFAVASTAEAASSAVAAGTAITEVGESHKQNIFADLTTSGKYYLVYSVFDSSDNVLRSETKTVYYINNTDAAMVEGTYPIAGTYSNNLGRYSLTLSVSDSPEEGNVMLSNFKEKSSSRDNTSSVVYYGVFNNNVLTFTYSNILSTPVWVDGNDASHYIGLGEGLDGTDWYYHTTSTDLVMNFDSSGHFTISEKFGNTYLSSGYWYAYDTIVTNASGTRIENIIGTYIGTAYSEHGGASVNDMTIVIAASDNPSLGNIKITQMGDITGNAYGQFDGNESISISRGQVFSTFTENASGYDRYSLLGLNYPNYTWSSTIEFIISGNTLTFAWADSSDTTNAYWLVLRETNESTWTADPTNGLGWSYGRCWRSLNLTK